MPPTPVPYTEWTRAEGVTPLTEPERNRLAETLPQTPMFVLAYGYLRHGVARAFVVGSPENPEAAIVQHHGAGEAQYFGRDPEAGWSLLARIPSWFCVSGSTEDMAQFAHILDREVPYPFRKRGDLFYTLETPPRPHSDPSVRLLGIPDIPLLQSARPEIQTGGYPTYEEVLTVGVAAAAVLDGRIVSLADNSASSPRYADIGVTTREEYRRRGLASAAACLVAQRIQARGLVPVWSTASDNRASQRVALKLGFQPFGRGEFLLSDALKASGGYRPI
jgi:GNAT superfamily N-acetyltransferase